MTTRTHKLSVTAFGIGLLSLILVACSQPATTDTVPTQAPAKEAESIMEDDTMTDDSMIKESTDSMKAMEDSEDSDTKVFELEAGSFYYKPDTITVKKGDKVKVVLNSVSMMHDFKIDKLNVAIPVTKSGETGEVEFIADTVGEFEFYCSVGQHRAQGQVGTLIVKE